MPQNKEEFAITEKGTVEVGVTRCGKISGIHLGSRGKA